MEIFKRIYVANKEIKILQDNVSDAISQIQSLPLVGGNVIKSIFLVSGQDNLLNHGLQRVPQAFIVTNLNGNSIVWSPPSPSLSNMQWNDQQINLRCSSSCTINLWVN